MEKDKYHERHDRKTFYDGVEDGRETRVGAVQNEEDGDRLEERDEFRTDALQLW